MVEGWEKVSILKCCDILDNMRRPLNQEQRSKIQGNIPYYGANNIQDYIDDFIFDESLILIAEDGGYFEEFATRPIAQRIEGKSWVNNHTHILRAKKDYYQDYIFYSLVHKNILYYIKGGTRSKLNKSDLEEIELLFPKEKKEQQKIADILSSVDSAIESTSKIISKQKRIKTALMQDLLTHGIDENGKIRSEQIHQYKDSPLGRIPAEWDNISVSQSCDILDNMRRPLNQEQRSKIQGNIPYYGANNIQDYINNFLFDEPLILIAEDGGYFEEFATRPIAQRVEGKSWVNNHTHILRAKKDYIQDYIFYSLVHKNILYYIKGGTRSKLNKSDLEEIEIAFPISKIEQQKIAHILSKQDEAIEQEDRKLAKLQRIKTALMQDLLSGKVRVKYE